MPYEAVIWIVAVLLLVEWLAPITHAFFFSRLEGRKTNVQNVAGTWVNFYRKWMPYKLVLLSVVAGLLYVGFTGNEVLVVLSAALITISATANMIILRKLVRSSTIDA